MNSVWSIKYLIKKTYNQTKFETNKIIKNEKCSHLYKNLIFTSFVVICELMDTFYVYFSHFCKNNDKYIIYCIKILTVG